MGNIILFIITLTIICLTLYFIYKSTEKSNSLVEKISYIILATVDSAILIIYYFDRFNVATELGWNTNVNTQNWLNFIATYTTGIISAGIAALVSVFVTIYQIKKNDEENDKRDKENFRIQNMPLLKYDCVQERNASVKLTQLDTNIEENKGVTQQITLSLKNIGLNSIRKYYMKIESNILKRKYIFEIVKESVIEKGQEVIIPFVLRLKTEEIYNFKITLYYQDLVFNIYEQDVILEYKLFSANDGLNHYYDYKFMVQDEKQIGDFPNMEIENIA